MLQYLNTNQWISSPPEVIDLRDRRCTVPYTPVHEIPNTPQQIGIWHDKLQNTSKQSDDFYDFFINQMKEHIRNLFANMDTLVEKQIEFHKFKINFSDNLNHFWNSIPEYDERNNLAVLLENCIENLHVEDIQEPQLKILTRMLDTLKQESVSEENTEMFFNEIVSTGMKPIGSLAGISSLYDD